MLPTIFELVILIALLEGVVILFFLFWGYKTIVGQVSETEKLKAWKNSAIKDISLLKSSDTRLLNIANLNADDNQCNKEQIGQIQDYMVRVLGISNLIGCTDRDIEPSDLIEEFRSRIEWAREVERLKNIDEYYEGD